MCRPTSSLSLLWPKYCSKNGEHNLAIEQVVNFRDRSSPIVWKLIIRTMNTKRHEENKPEFMKNWHEKLITEELRRCRKWKEFRKYEFSRHDLRESQAIVNEFTPNTGVARKSERCERLQGIPGCRISRQWKRPTLMPASRGRLTACRHCGPGCGASLQQAARLLWLCRTHRPAPPVGNAPWFRRRRSAEYWIWA